MLKSNKKLTMLAQVGFSVAQVITKWLFGVLLRKLLDASFADNDGAAVVSQPTRPLLNFVFLFDMQFYEILGIAVSVLVLLNLCSATLQAQSVFESTDRGRQLRSQILEKAVSGSGGFDCADVARTANDLITKVKTIEDFVAFDEPWIPVNYLSVFLALSLSITFAWFAGLAAVALFILSFIVLVTSDKMRVKMLLAIEENALEVNARLLDIVKNGVKVKIMGMGEAERSALSKLEEASDDARRSDAKIKFFREFFRLFALGVISPVMIVLAWQLAQSEDPATAADISSSVLVAILMLDEGHKALLDQFHKLDKQVGAVEAQNAIDEFLGHQKENSDKTLCDDDHIDPLSSVGSEGDDDINQAEAGGTKNNWSIDVLDEAPGLDLKSVMLAYPYRETPVLNCYTHSFGKGEIHAIVGESGSGKSSVLKVIADLIQPEEGNITYWNGMKIAYVSQDQKLFARTIRENVSYGAEEPITDNDIWAALETANIADFVESLPRKLDEPMLQGEASISGGQLQRLNLAHLFCACKNADLVILDEVLSALDPTSRDLLLNRLKKFLNGKTALVVTHHAEMLRICDDVHEMPSPTRPRSFVRRASGKAPSRTRRHGSGVSISSAGSFVLYVSGRVPSSRVPSILPKSDIRLEAPQPLSVMSLGSPNVKYPARYGSRGLTKCPVPREH